MVQKLTLKNDHQNGYIKMICTGGYSPDGYTPPDEANLLMFSFPFKNFGKKDADQGFNLIMSEYLRPNPLVKSTNYFNSVKNYPRMKEYDAVDVLYHYNGRLSECSRCNVFVVKDGVICTPDSGMLEGITRHRVLEHMDKGYDIRIQPVGVHELFTADELFITSSTKGVMPVVNVEGRPINQGEVGPISKSLSEKLGEF
jgi:branched-subunit amino acid aminotransferase/4-amino-4-deoxychorismate lyase